MKATGIVRRIDDLGRVVIPKEIRRTLRIREGDPLEIFVDREGEVILKKYSPINELGAFAREYAESINESIGRAVFISDRDNIIAANGVPKKDFLGKSVGLLIEKAMNERKMIFNTYTNMNMDAQKGSLIYDDNGDEIYRFSSEMVVPIVCQGDAIGGVIVCSKDPKDALGQVEAKVAETAAAFLAKQMEQ